MIEWQRPGYYGIDAERYNWWKETNDDILWRKLGCSSCPETSTWANGANTQENSLGASASY